MSRIRPVNHEESTGKAKDLLDAVKAKFGAVPNMMKTMAQSPAVLDAYLKFSGTLGEGRLPGTLREQIALASAEINDCGYCAAAHTALGKRVGLGEDAIVAAREGQAADPKVDAALKFVRALVVNRGDVSSADLGAVQAAGWSEGDVAEIIANTALNIFTNYFNRIAGTEIDFPIARPLNAR